MIPGMKVFIAYLRAYLCCWTNLHKGWVVVAEWSVDDDTLAECTTFVGVADKDGQMQRSFL